MSGEEIVRYLEASYERWINTISSPRERLLKIQPRDDARTSQSRWSFENSAFNFDSAGGLNYTVDVTKPFGSRVNVRSLANGAAFEPAARYNVAMTSYRASGGGGLLKEAGVDTDRIDDRTVARYPEIRNILYDYLMANGSIDPEVIGNPAVVGSWEFIPASLVKPALDADMALLFR
jgi:2',3'-cyclic-nucleotide 2'-phosphodiesterase/3'-nucleotidase